MTQVLCCYGTSEGQTAAIAERMGDVIDAEGHDVMLVHLRHPPDDLDPGAYDGVIVGASIHGGSHQTYVTRFVRDHAETLNRRPSAFFSVNVTAAHENPEARAPAADVLETFLDETGWNPDGTLAVTGAHKYNGEYGLLKRFVMRRIAGRAGSDTDTSRNDEYPDWDAVEAFAREFTTLLRGESFSN